MQYLDLLKDINFWIPALGATLLGTVSGMVGSISVLRGQSLIGDSIGHSVFPGVVIAFMLFQTRNPSILMLGAILAGFIAYLLIQAISNKSTTKLDTSLAIVLSTMFGLGVVLKSYIQGNIAYRHTSQAGLEKYIFGQAAYTDKSDVKILFVVSIVNLLLLCLFYKEIKIFVFDYEFSQLTGFRPKLLSIVILLSSLSLIAVGLRIVGAILISSMLVAPAVGAIQWTVKFNRMLLLAGFFGGFSSLLGTIFAYYGLPNGPSIILVMSLIAILSMILGYRGPLRKIWRKQ